MQNSEMVIACDLFVMRSVLLPSRRLKEAAADSFFGPLWPFAPSSFQFAAVQESAFGRYCCKSLFALVIKNSPGCRRDFRVKMWGTSSPDDKLTSDLGSVIETAQIGGRRSDRLMAGKLSPGNFGLLQQYRPKADLPRCLLFGRF